MRYLNPPWIILADSTVVTVVSALVSALWHIQVVVVSQINPEIRKLTHLYFKRYEPQSPIRALSILFGVPSFLSLLDVYAGWTASCIHSGWKVPGVYFATLIGSIAVYRISPFHPLAKYPGPFIAKLSKFWMVDSVLLPPYITLGADRYT